jgi:uncharacterized membrane protein YeaQ/YmgE (transglycosylase-associated protein family)
MDLVFWMIIGVMAGTLANRAIAGEGPWGFPGDLIVGGIGALAAD